MDWGTAWVNDQQHRYFHIDRKFGSGSVQDIHEALDDLELFLGTITKMDLANSLIVRLTELIPSTKSLLFKHRAADIFAHHSPLILKLPSRDEITASLFRFIKAGDEVTRIVCLQIASHLAGSWIRDLEFYHILLGKLSASNSLGVQQKKEAIVCLRKLLLACPPFSKTFSKNILQLIEIYQIPLRILLYLLLFATIDSHYQKQLLQELLALMTAPHYHSSKKEILYLQRVVLKFAHVNYRIIEFYQKSSLSTHLPRIQSAMESIRSKKYEFLNQDPAADDRQEGKVESLIDELYSKKKIGRLQDEYQKYQDTIYSFVDGNFAVSDNMQTIILLLYFIEDNPTHYDRILKKHIANQNLSPTFPFFKKLAVVGCFETALLVLSQLHIGELNYVFLRCYFEFKGQREPKKIDELRDIAEAISPELHSIVYAWQLMDSILRFQLTSSWEQIGQLQKQLIKLVKQLDSRWKELVIVCEIFGSMREGQTCFELKQKCYPYLPSSLMSASSYWYAHFNKESINSILKLKL